MTTVGWANAGLRFLLELAALGAIGLWGWRVTEVAALRWTLALGLPLVMAVLWGTFLSPKAAVPLGTWPTVALQLLVFAAAVLALVGSGFRWLGIAFAAVAVLNAAGLLLWPVTLQPPAS